MNPQQRRALADLLARLVTDGEITEEQAIQIYLSVADDGSLLDNALPLPPYEGIANPPVDEDWPGVLWLLLATAIGLAPGRAGVPQAIDFAPLSVRMDAADRLQDWHTDAAMRLARDLSAGRLTVATFQRELRTLNNQHNAAQVMLGAGSRYPRMAAALSEQLTLQAAFLQRFADQIGGRLAAARAGLAGFAPLSMGQIAERAALYGGIGRTLFFQSFEAQRQIDTGAGWVIYYQAREDANTCSRCLAAQGYYLPGQGPYPGQVCLGRHHCRCRRITVYDPARYAELTGLPTVGTAAP